MMNCHECPVEEVIRIDQSQLECIKENFGIKTVGDLAMLTEEMIRSKKAVKEDTLDKLKSQLSACGLSLKSSYKVTRRRKSPFRIEQKSSLNVFGLKQFLCEYDGLICLYATHKDWEATRHLYVGDTKNIPDEFLGMRIVHLYPDLCEEDKTYTTILKAQVAPMFGNAFGKEDGVPIRD